MAVGEVKGQRAIIRSPGREIRLDVNWVKQHFRKDIERSLKLVDKAVKWGGLMALTEVLDPRKGVSDQAIADIIDHTVTPAKVFKEFGNILGRRITKEETTHDDPVSELELQQAVDCLTGIMHGANYPIIVNIIADFARRTDNKSQTSAIRLANTLLILFSETIRHPLPINVIMEQLDDLTQARMIYALGKLADPSVARLVAKITQVATRDAIERATEWHKSDLRAMAEERRAQAALAAAERAPLVIEEVEAQPTPAKAEEGKPAPSPTAAMDDWEEGQ